jgi:hypothetical protein
VKSMAMAGFLACREVVPSQDAACGGGVCQAAAFG